jgi:hypothetical protein
MSENGRLTIYHIRQIAAERPNHVHGEQCVYVTLTRNGYVPGCLVGHGLWRAGLITAKFRRNDRNRMAIRNLQRYFGFDTNETDWLMEVQRRQDNRHTWRMAVEWADLLYPLTPPTIQPNHELIDA